MAEKNNFAELSFAASEAYKLLRTNILFSFTEEKSCYTIGITSAMRGEGKSTTSSNLAYAFAEAGKKTLVVDSDLRLPKLARKFAIHRSPGLSNVLTGVDKGRLCIAKINDNLFVLPSGNIPPNPSEILASEKMKNVIETLKNEFDIIIFDLPPVTAVSDALVVSPILDGMIVVVREDFADKRALADAMRSLEFAGTKILGFVTTCSTDNLNKYGYKKYKKYAYKKYAYRKGYDYSAQYAAQRESIDE